MTSPTRPGRIVAHDGGNTLLICVPGSRKVMWIETNQASWLLRWLGSATRNSAPHCGPRMEHIIPARSTEALARIPVRPRD